MIIAYQNRTATIRVPIRDNGKWLSPPFTKGYFGLAPLAVPPTLQNAVTPVFERNTGGANVRFINLAESGEDRWHLDADILPADTAGLTPRDYYYEARLDLSAGSSDWRRGSCGCRAQLPDAQAKAAKALA